jgi:hypothetical protein
MFRVIGVVGKGFVCIGDWGRDHIPAACPLAEIN